MPRPRHYVPPTTTTEQPPGADETSADETSFISQLEQDLQEIDAGDAHGDDPEMRDPDVAESETDREVKRRRGTEAPREGRGIFESVVFSDAGATDATEERTHEDIIKELLEDFGDFREFAEAATATGRDEGDGRDRDGAERGARRLECLLPLLFALVLQVFCVTTDAGPDISAAKDRLCGEGNTNGCWLAS